MAKEHPKIKITFHDYTEGLVKNPAQDESWVFQTREYFQPGWIYKHDFRAVKDHMQVLDSGKKFCILYGSDKPRVIHKNGRYVFNFIDRM